MLRTTEFQGGLNFENAMGWKEKKEILQGVVRILMEFRGIEEKILESTRGWGQFLWNSRGRKEKSNGKFQGGSESFDGRGTVSENRNH